MLHLSQIIWALRNIPRTPEQGGGVSVRLYLWFKERFTLFGNQMLLLAILLTFIAAFPNNGSLRGIVTFFWVFLIGSYLKTFKKPPLSAHWSVPKFVDFNQEFVIKVFISNTSSKTLYNVSAQIFYEENWLVLTRSVEVIKALPGKQSAEVSVYLRGVSRGPCKLQGPVVFVLDHFGWTRAKVKINSPCVIGIRPPVLQNSMSSAQGFLNSKMQDLEWLGTLRPYRKGDAIRSIDHRAWARTRKPLIREVAFDQSGLFVHIDTGLLTFFDRVKLEIFLSKAVQIVRDLEQAKSLQGCAINGHVLLAKNGALVSEVLANQMALLPRPLWWKWPKPKQISNDLIDDSQLVLTPYTLKGV